MVPNSIMKTLKQTKKTITLRFRISLHWQLEHEKLRTMASQTTVGVSSCSPSLPSHLHGAGTNRPARCLSTPACGTNPDTPHCSSQGSTDAKMLELYKLLSFLWMWGMVETSGYILQSVCEHFLYRQKWREQEKNKIILLTHLMFKTANTVIIQSCSWSKYCWWLNKQGFSCPNVSYNLLNT